MCPIIDAILGLGSAGLSTTGLVLDAVGVGLLFFCGLPSPVSPFDIETKGVLQWGGASEEERQEYEKKYRRYRRGAHTGLALLVLGFALQIAANYVPAT